MIKIFKSTTVERKIEFRELYRPQFSISEYNTEIREIISKVRPDYSYKQILNVKTLRLKEIVMFISKHGTPVGYELDEEMESRVERYERVAAIIKAASWIKESKK